MAERPRDVPHPVAQVEKHIRVPAEVARRKQRDAAVHLEKAVFDVPGDAAGHAAALVLKQAYRLGAVFEFCAVLPCRLVYRAHDKRPHIDIRLLVTPLEQADEAAGAAGGAVKVRVPVPVVDPCIAPDVFLGNMLQEPVEHLAGPGHIVAHQLRVSVPQRLAHIFVKNLHEVIFRNAALQKITGVVGRHIAGVVVIFLPGLAFEAQHLGAELRRAKRGRRAGLTRADDKQLAVLLIGKLRYLRRLAQPERSVFHGLVGREPQSGNLPDPHGREGKAVALLDDVFLRCARSLGLRVLAPVALAVGQLQKLLQ